MILWKVPNANLYRYGEGYVMMWGYFNSKSQGNFIRMHSVLDP